MAFSYKGGGQNGSDSSATASVTHGQTINEGDLVVAYVNSNSTSAISNDAGGAAWTNPINETPTSETARHALFWKVAGASEPATYTWTLNATTFYRAIVRVYSSATDAVVDAAANSARTSSSTSQFECNAIDGETISEDALSVIFGGKDNRNSSQAATSADNSYVNVLGNRANQGAVSADRIYTTETTFSGAVTINTALNLPDFTYSIHISFLESSSGFTLDADSGSYTYTGTANSLLLSAVLGGDTGIYTVTGTDADLNAGRLVEANTGSYTYSGTDAGLIFEAPGSFTLTADTGAYTVSGTDSDLKASFNLPADTGVYSYTGTANNFLLGVVLEADSGAYSYSGTEVDLRIPAKLVADSGTYNYSGSDVILKASGQAWTIQADVVTTWTEQTDSDTTWTIQ